MSQIFINQKESSSRFLKLPMLNLALAVIYLTGAVSIFAGQRDAPFSISLAIDGLLILMAITISVKRQTKIRYSWLIPIIVYYFIYLFMSLSNNETLADVTLACKFLLYMALFSMLGEWRAAGTLTLITLFRTLLLLFIAKYLMYVFYIGGTRPGLLIENNFELMFLMIVALAAFSVRKANIFEMIGLSCVVFLSGSRSAILAFLVLLAIGGFGLSHASKNHNLMVRLFIITLAIAIAPIALSIFGSGYNVLESDRHLFLLEFVNEASLRGAANVIFGSGQLLPLDDDVCTSLQAWNRVFGELREDVCHSVIMHSGIMRIVIDHGMVMLVICIAFYRSLLMRFYNKKVVYSIIVLSLINGMSVSGFYSTYFALGVFLVIFLRPRMTDNGNTPDNKLSYR